MLLKKLTSFILSAALVLSLLNTGFFSWVQAVSISEFNDYAYYGTQISNALAKVVWQDDGVHAYESIEAQDGNSFLWGYGSYLEGLGARVRNNPLDGNAVAEYKKALNNVLQYEATNLYEKYGITEADYLAMNCLPNNTTTEVFYDDDVWIQKEFLNAYNTLGDSEYLDIARRLLNYIYRGWDDEFGGGIYWRDTGYGGTSGKNTCINAPAAMASCQMYLATGEESYLDWAVRIYDWTKEKFLDPEDHLLWDNVGYNSETGEESIDKAKYTYNAGCFISAAALLYQITGNSEYLTDAQATADSAYQKWLTQKDISALGETGYVWTSTHTWFNGNLVEGFLYLCKMDQDATYVNACLNSLAVACLTKPESEDGWVQDNWQGGTSISLANVSLLQQSATVRTLFMLSDYQKDNTDVTEAIHTVSQMEAGSDAQKNALKNTLLLYYSMPAAERVLVPNRNLLDTAMQDCLGADAAAKIQEITTGIQNFHVITYQTESELLSLFDTYNSLTDEQKEYVVYFDVLHALMEYQKEIYNAYNLTITGWADGSKTPWLQYASEEEQVATRNAVSDEIFYQYRANYYKMGVIRGSKSLGEYGSMVGLQMEDRPNDNVGNPWGYTGRYWAMVIVPFRGMSFSVNGYFSRYFQYQLPIGNAFEYNGVVYQQYWNNYYSYEDTPIVADGTVSLKGTQSYPGYNGTEDLTANTFRYAYAAYAQENKWQSKTLGVSADYAQQYQNLIYQQFMGPDGTDYIINTTERVDTVAAVDPTDESYELVLQENSAYVVAGELADSFLSLGSDDAQRLSITGAPVEVFSDSVMYFENGVLTPAGFEVNNENTTAFSKVNEAIAAIPDVDSITLDDEYLVINARVQYDALDAVWQQYVTHYDVLLSAESKIADIKQELSDRDAASTVDAHILNLHQGALTLSSKEPVQNVRNEYEALNNQAKSFVTQLDYLISCESEIEELYADIHAINAGIAALKTITYKDGVTVRSLLAQYQALSEEEQSYIVGLDTLQSAQTQLDALYDAFDVTVTGWSTAEKTPWLNNVSEAQKEETRTAVSDEIKYQYVMKSYNLGIANGDSRSLGNYGEMVGLQLENQPNDNVGNPWNAGGRYWAMVVVPFSGMSFSINGYFSRYFQYQLPIGNAFEYNGVVYQQYWNGYYSYEDTPIVPDGTVSLKGTQSYPGYNGTEDLTANTFRYAYAAYAQKHKWTEETLGIPVSNAVETGGLVYQKFVGPNGVAFLVNTEERISNCDPTDETSMSENTAFAITGAMAEVLDAYGENPFENLGKPIAQVNANTIEFEKGILTDTQFYSATDHAQDIIDSLELQVSDGMVTQSSLEGRLNITWNCEIHTTEFNDFSLNLINQTGIKVLSYGVYYGTSREEIEDFLSGNTDAEVRSIVFDQVENYSEKDEINIYKQFSFRLKDVPQDRNRCALFYLVYELNGETKTLFSSFVDVTAVN